MSGRAPRRGGPWLVLGALVVLGSAPPIARAAPPAHTRRLVPSPEVPRPVLSARDAKLDTALRRLVAPATISESRSRTFAPVVGPWRRGDGLHVEVRLGSGAAVGDLAPHGFVLERAAGDVVQGWIPSGRLLGMAALDAVRSIRPVRPGRLRATADAASRADLARAAGWGGTGVTVGVISDGAGTLPASVVPIGCDAGSGSEGQAIAEIVSTLAPGTTVLFASGIASSMGFIDAVNCLRAAGAQVIVDDLGFFDQPFFQDGSVAQAVRSAVQAGVSYHSAAGNEATSHYGATFLVTTGNSYHDFAGAGSPDNLDEIDLAPGEQLDCILQWNDPFGAASDDYDLELYDLGTMSPTLVVASANPQTGTQDPFEEVAVTNVGSTTGRAGVAIRRVSGDVRVLGLFCFGGSLPEYLTLAGSVIGHPAVSEVVAVGAIDVSDPGLDTVEPYSSQGPVGIYFPAPETRAKPDLAAFDGVTSSTPGFSPFFGTSAAAPDSAAVAALMLSKNSCRLPAQIQSALRSAAVDIGAPGDDPVSGAGRLDALAAVDATPLPTCTLDSECDDGDRCTSDTCAGCACEHGTACDDGDACTTDGCDPATGCTFAPIEGFAGVACVCGRTLGGGACAGASVPAKVQKRFDLACRLIARAAGTSKTKQKRRLVARGLVDFAHARHKVAAAMRKGAVATGCGDSLNTVIGDVRGRAFRLRQTL